ncbi:MAG: GNAT family N-acetyltransferase [Bacteriovorax sp.]
MTPSNFALATLSSNPEYFEEVVRLIEEEFHYSKEQCFEKDFAPLMDPLNFENCFLYIDRENNSVAAHLAVCPRHMIKNNGQLNIALIGGIATHKKHRGKNLFKGLMNHALSTYKDKVGLFILWSDLENLYEKFSFYRTGGLIETGKRNFSASERPSGYEKTKFSSLTDKDFNTINALYSHFNETYFFTIKRDNRDWSIIREMNSIDLFVKRNSSNEIERYFCVNKGRDLTNIIHEISCRNSNEYSLLLKELESFKMWLPETESDKFPNSDIFYTAFIKLGSLSLLNSFLKEITKGQLNVQKTENNQVVFEFENKQYEASHKDFLQYLFGPKPLKEFESFKLSPYIAGLDSI